MKKISMLLILCFLCLTAEKCDKSATEITINTNLEQITYYEFNENYTNRQVDSVCVLENIPTDLRSWISSQILSPERIILQSMYVKNDSTVYILTDLDSLYNFKKRVTRVVQKETN